MKDFLIIFLLYIMNIQNCQNKNSTAGNQNEHVSTLLISFISKGSGINYTAKNVFDEYIASFEKKHNVKIQYEEHGWGREGEVDYCINLSNLKDKEKNIFLSGTYERLSNQDNVIIEKNGECRHKKN